jgi:hypothetical protein
MRIFAVSALLLLSLPARAEKLDFRYGFTRLPGVWFPTKPASAGTVKIEEEGTRLTFRGFSAVRHDTPFAPGQDGAWTVRATVDPVLGDQQSLGWVSFMLGPEKDQLGWVTAGENTIGVLLRSNGEMQVFAREAEWKQVWDKGPPTPASRYQVELSFRREGGSLHVTGQVNEARFTSEVTGVTAGERPLYLSIGAHFHPGDVERSSVSGLEIKASARRRHRSQ